MADARTLGPTVFPRLAVGLATLFSLIVLPSLPPAGTVDAALPGPQEGRSDFFVLEDLYRDLLADWASDPEDGVVGAAQLGIDLAWRPRCLDAVVENTARRLGQKSRDALLSVAHLHAELFLWHASELNLREAGQTSVRLRRIVDLVVESTDEPEAAAPALDLLFHVATSAIRDRYPQELTYARELLDHLLELEPGSPRALAWLAFLEEIEDRPVRAVRRLEHSGHREPPRRYHPQCPPRSGRAQPNRGPGNGRQRRAQDAVVDLGVVRRALVHFFPVLPYAQIFIAGGILFAGLFPLTAYALEAAFNLGLPLRYWFDLSILVLTYVMLGWGLNIVVGLAGLLDLGYVAFYAVGAYTFALLATHFGLGFWICLPIAGAAHLATAFREGLKGEEKPEEPAKPLPKDEQDSARS